MTMVKGFQEIGYDELMDVSGGVDVGGGVNFGPISIDSNGNITFTAELSFMGFGGYVSVSIGPQDFINAGGTLWNALLYATGYGWVVRNGSN